MVILQRMAMDPGRNGDGDGDGAKPWFAWACGHHPRQLFAPHRLEATVVEVLCRSVDVYMEVAAYVDSPQEEVLQVSASCCFS